MFILPEKLESVEELDLWFITKSDNGLTQKMIDIQRAIFTSRQKADDMFYFEMVNGVEKAKQVVDKYYSDYEKKAKEREQKEITITFKEYKELREIKKKYELAKVCFE